MPNLFDSLTIRDITFQNRIAVSPMCQYSSQNGFANDWHLVHLGSRAVGGAGLVLTEAAAVLAEARISPQDLGIWNDGHIEPLARIARFIHGQGSIPGIQLAHAGRKASTYRPWEGRGVVPEAEGGWRKIVGPSPLPFAPGYAVPEPLTQQGIQEVVNAFSEAARRALEAGFCVVEIHAAHGYLIHEFLSPFSNRRRDRYGGSFENRTRLVHEVVAAVRGVWPERLPLFIRISATDWAGEGWDLTQSIELARQLKEQNVDLIDCSSGGNLPDEKIPISPGYQIRFAQRIREESGMMTAAVGLITSPRQADQIVGSHEADIVLLAREFLRDPYWPLHAASELGHKVPWPAQYLRSAPDGAGTRTPVDHERLARCYSEHHAIGSQERPQ